MHRFLYVVHNILYIAHVFKIKIDYTTPPKNGYLTETFVHNKYIFRDEKENSKT